MDDPRLPGDAWQYRMLYVNGDILALLTSNDAADDEVIDMERISLN